MSPLTVKRPSGGISVKRPSRKPKSGRKAKLTGLRRAKKR